jgi:hypothetical protein
VRHWQAFVALIKKMYLRRSAMENMIHFIEKSGGRKILKAAAGDFNRRLDEPP